MANMSNYLEVELRKHIFRTGAFSKPSGLYVALHVGDPTDTGTGGAEVTGGSYARVARAPLDANWTAPDATGGATANVADIEFPAPTANWGTITHMGIWDAATTGNMLFWGALGTPKVVNNGDPAPKFPASTITVTFA